ncbi:MAG TPA: FAD-dependent oxidoreductase, partial [Stellaceae bacterium]
MPVNGSKRVGVIGAGMVGVCTASWLQRDGHSVFLVEAGEPGHGASFGNAGCFNGSSVTPMSMPGVI